MSAHDGAEPDDGAGRDEAAETTAVEVVGDESRRRRLVALLDDGEIVGGGGYGSAYRDPTAGARPRPRGLPGLRGRLERLCAITVSEVAVDGAGVTVMGSADAGLAGHRDQLAATGALTRRLEDLQLTAGEGPCLDAYASGMPVLTADVTTEATRWVGFGPEALTAGAAALFSLPLQVGVVRLGTLDLHRATVGALSRQQLADALVLAGLATETLLELAENPDPSPENAGPEGAGPGVLGPGSGAGWLPDVHAEVHQASGMVSAREHVGVGEALLRIRAYAFSHGEPIHQVARRIIDRDLTLGQT